MSEPRDPLETAILSRFFSRTEPREHADVYLVRKLPQEILATLNGLYSRSQLSMRETFLRRLKRGLGEQGKTLADLPLPDTTEDVLSRILVDRSGKFLRTYAIDQGHNSLREGAVLHLAVEQVSQLVTRFIQRERRASFEESSTRYISFSSEGHWRDPEVHDAGAPFASAYDDAIAESFALYEEAVATLREHLRATRPAHAGDDEKTWERAVRAEAFDSARYLLTPAIHTKFALVADARTVSDTVRRLLSQPLAEFRIVGQRIRDEAEREVPTLLAHAREDPSLSRTRTICERTAPRAALGTSASRGLRLVACPADLDTRLLASLVYESSNLPLDALYRDLAARPAAERAELFEEVLASRGAHDPVPEGFEGAGVLDFECLLDFGAYRDVGRHRKGFQQQQTLTTEHGFAVPPLIDEAGLGARYREVLSSAGASARRVAERFPLAAGYVTPFAFLQRVRLRFDAAQVAYFCELRSAPEGHFSYRGLAIEMADLLAERAPLYARWLRVCRDRVLCGRAESEAEAAERRARREERARQLGFEL